MTTTQHTPTLAAPDATYLTPNTPTPSSTLFSALGPYGIVMVYDEVSQMATLVQLDPEGKNRLISPDSLRGITSECPVALWVLERFECLSTAWTLDASGCANKILAELKRVDMDYAERNMKRDIQIQTAATGSLFTSPPRRLSSSIAPGAPNRFKALQRYSKMSDQDLKVADYPRYLRRMRYRSAETRSLDERLKDLSTEFEEAKNQ